MAARTLPPFRADHVGSLLRSPELLAARAGRAAGTVSAEELKRRIDEAARYVPLEQLCLSPQCGFSSTVEGNVLTREEQAAKLRLIVDTAAEVWGAP
jgi:methionine synthase II (cobalamin-independent)